VEFISISLLQASLSLLRLSFFDFHEKKGGNGFGFGQRNCRAESDGENVETIYFGEERLAC
jgi:hypothetical protein